MAPGFYAHQENGLRWKSMIRSHLAPDHSVSSTAAEKTGVARFLLASLLVVSGTMIGCGSPAAPQPPSLNLPIAVLNLTAARIDSSVRLAWTMPTRTTDHVVLRHPITAQVCRAVEKGPCASIAKLNLPPGGAGAYTDQLPTDLAHGPDRLLRYEIALLNHAGKSAGPSNAAYSAAGASPPRLTGLTAQVRQDGVLLSWQPAAEPGETILFRIERHQVTATVPAEDSKSPLPASVPPVDQTLVVHGLDVDPGRALDNSALFNQQYRYLVERVATLAFSGQSVEVQGPASDAVLVTTTKKFPPTVPQGLVAVADAAAGAIDLSWSPDSDSDLAAYRVYRRDVHESLPAQRIASVGTETSFRDTGAQPEHTYAYSVSAIDQSGNESEHSPEIEETLPAR
jgi:hypothetical protein